VYLQTPRISASHLLLAALIAFMVTASSALAHRLNVFASVDGEKIVGYAYFPGGGRAHNAKIRILDDAGQLLGETTTDKNGDFSYIAQRRCEHIIVVESGDGHEGRWVIAADELPESLPGPQTTDGASDATPALSTTHDPPANAEPTAAAPTPIDRQLLASLIDKELSRQIRPLREQLDQYENQTRIRDILGGIGYIIGLGGLAFFLTGRRKSK
jgi:nickel transport protein